MKPRLLQGLAVAVVHVLIVAGLGGKLIWDRATRPRVWARTAPVDPDLPIRGRYVSLRLEATIDPGLDLPVRSDDGTQPIRFEPLPLVLVERDGQLSAAAAAGHETLRVHVAERDGRPVVVPPRALVPGCSPVETRLLAVTLSVGLGSPARCVW